MAMNIGRLPIPKAQISPELLEPGSVIFAPPEQPARIDQPEEATRWQGVFPC